MLPEEVAQLVGAICVFVVGLFIILKVTQLVIKLGVAAIVLGILFILFHDWLPL